jgi:hypothetical protein
MKSAEARKFCVPCPTTTCPDCLACAGRTPAASSGVFHFEGSVESAAAPTAAPNTFMASRRDIFFSVIILLLEDGDVLLCYRLICGSKTSGKPPGIILNRVMRDLNLIGF